MNRVVVTGLAALVLVAACQAVAVPPSPPGMAVASQAATPAITAPSPSEMTAAPSPSPSAERTPSPTATATPSGTPPPTPAPTASAPQSSPAPSDPAAPTIAQLVGQKLVVAMSGTTPSAGLLARIRRGEVGGVILFGRNITSASQLVALTGKLQAAARAGGEPPLMITTDQEGGSVKRIPWAPPTMSAPQIGATGSTSVARSQGAATANALRKLGINVDLAPVADVPASKSSFMYLQGRTYSFSATRTAALADAFATGLESGHVLPTMKHFPGLGYAIRNTDLYAVTIGASRTALAPGLLPYRTAIGHDLPIVMLSNAIYSAYDTRSAAGWSHAISVTLLRERLGFTGVTITDGLDGAAATRHLTTATVAIAAAKAGTDMLLVTGSEAESASVFKTLVARATSGNIPLATLRTSYARIEELKAHL